MTIRLDSALAERGLARSRTHAVSLIDQGLVSVDGRPVVKPSHRVAEDATIVVAESDHYVSRAAHKLIAALDAFAIDPRGQTALDAGASTGGFSQVLLERGAHRVIAVDVGHGQLSPEMKDDGRLLYLEGINIRYFTREALAEFTGGPSFLGLVVADLSFISLTQVLPALVALAEQTADFVLLVKPQFEVGRSGVREGIVHDPARRSDAIMSVLWAGWDLGVGTAGLVSSPIVGTHGNAEYLVHLSRTVGVNPTEWIDSANESAGA